MKVLVTGLFTQAGLFAIRRFAELGYEVTAADCHPLAFGKYSKYVKKRIELPSLRKDPTGYAEKLIQELERGQYDLYFPSFEESYLLSRYKNRIESLTNTVLHSPGYVLRLFDKSTLKEVVETAGARYPDTFCPSSLNELDEIIDRIDFPVYIKMKQSRNSTGLRYVEDPNDIKDAYLDVIRRNDLGPEQLPLIQRCIKGPEIAMSELAQNGEVIAHTAHVGVRYIPRNGGTTCCRKTVVHERCAREAEKIIRSIGYTGFISLDFMIDENTQEIFVIDCNPRPSICINVGYYGDVDMIPEWIKIASGQKAQTLRQIIPEVKSATVFADLYWYLLTFLVGPETWKQRRQLRKEWRQSRKTIQDDMHRPGDIKPMFILYFFLVCQAVKSIFSKLELSNLYLYHNCFDESFLQGGTSSHLTEESNELFPSLTKLAPAQTPETLVPFHPANPGETGPFPAAEPVVSRYSKAPKQQPTSASLG
jgi:biotin carboxylase